VGILLSHCKLILQKYVSKKERARKEQEKIIKKLYWTVQTTKHCTSRPNLGPSTTGMKKKLQFS
jgi:hypothetical protein